MSRPLRIGLIINPLAGLGGSLALKGSDGEAIRALARTMDRAEMSRSMSRTARALKVLAQGGSDAEILTCPGRMGEQLLERLTLSYSVCGDKLSGLTAAADTRRAAAALSEAGADIIVFAGGDGTARDVFDALGDQCPVLGIPAGVKMQSGVFAVSPEAAGELLLSLSRGGLVGLALQEVRDIDEEAFRQDKVRSRFYGEMLVPSEGRYLQHTKVGGRESEELVAAEIGAWIVEEMDETTTYLIGPGSTTAAIMAELGLPNTLLGVDVVRGGELIASDATEARLLEVLADCPGQACVIVTVIGGQGHVFGRGNQQFSPAVLRRVGLQNIRIVAAKSKITALQAQRLLVDTNDPELDAALCGYRPVITGYRDQILYNIGLSGA